MPKYTPDTALRRATTLVKPLIRNGFNESKTARQLGVTPQAINQRLKHKSVRDILQKFLDSPKLDKALIEVGIDGLKAERSTGAAILVQKDGSLVKADDEGGIMIADHNARHKYWHDLLVAKGKLKMNGNGNGVSVVNIIYAYRKPVEKEICQQP